MALLNGILRDALILREITPKLEGLLSPEQFKNLFECRDRIVKYVNL